MFYGLKDLGHNVTVLTGKPNYPSGVIYEDFKNNPNKEYIVFCGLGGQSALSTKTMSEMGLKNVKNMAGGYKEWTEKK